MIPLTEFAHPKQAAVKAIGQVNLALCCSSDTGDCQCGKFTVSVGRYLFQWSRYGFSANANVCRGYIRCGVGMSTFYLPFSLTKVAGRLIGVITNRRMHDHFS